MPDPVPTSVGVLQQLADIRRRQAALTAEFHRLILEADAVHTNAEIGEALGVTRGRAYQLVRAARQRA